jgi:threonine dehydratase
MKNKDLPKLVEEAYERLKNVVVKTPLERSERLSKKYRAEIYLKREDLQLVRSYKLRGAYNKIYLLSQKEKNKGVVCASAGNHAQGVAFSCAKLKVKGIVYMPKNTPKQKVERVKVLGGKWISLELFGETFDDSYLKAEEYSEKTKKVFVHPFDDEFVMAGQGTVGLEILNQLKKTPDYFIVPVGGGGLLAGLGAYVKSKNKNTKIFGVEPEGAPSMAKSLEKNKVVTLEKIDKFIDGAAVKTVGLKTFEESKNYLDSMILVPEGKVCEEMISLYQSDGIIAEPAGALSVSALDYIKDQIKGKVVVCIVSGGNNDISRYPEIMERSLLYKGLKHYFLVEFSQRPGALREYLDYVLGKNDDITLFEYVKKSNRETGPALVGIELSDKKDFKPLLERMNERGFKYEMIDKNSPLFRFIV